MTFSYTESNKMKLLLNDKISWKLRLHYRIEEHTETLVHATV